MKLYDNLYKTKGITLHEPTFERIIHWFPSTGNMLSAGCGWYIEADLLAKNGKNLEFYGIDISEEAFKKVVQRVKRKNLVVADVREKFPYPDNYFDVVYSGEVVEHIGSVENFFRECARVMKPDGVFILTCPLLGWWKYRLKLLLGQDIFDDYHVRFLTLKTIKNNLKENKLYIEDYRLAGRMPKRFRGHGFFKVRKYKFKKK